MEKLPEEVKQTLKNAANNLQGTKRRVFMAQTVKDLLGGSARKAERELGWWRKTVEKGMKELETGKAYGDNYSSRGVKKTEKKWPELEQSIRELVEPHSQADPSMKSSLVYTRITAKAVREALVEDKGYSDQMLPTERTISSILNRLGYKLRRVQKTKPKKKIAETDEIFDNVNKVNKEADKNEQILRISIDTKAKVNIGEFSRNGKCRGNRATQALDHDMQPQAKLVPFGILDVVAGLVTFIFGTSIETSDFYFDCLMLWWEENKQLYEHITELVINLDNGPQLASNRTQFIKRIVEFADHIERRIHLIYYPPYHSKYNPIERVWGILEEHWNGTLLDSIDKTLQWAASMTWKGIEPTVHLADKVYRKGISLVGQEMKRYESYLDRSSTLPKWDVIIEPI